MKGFIKVLALGAVVAASSGMAFADNIQLTGGFSFDTSTGDVTFNNNKSAVQYAGTGILSDFGVNSTVTFYDFTYNTDPTPSQELLKVVAKDGAELEFFMTSESYSSSYDATTDITTYTLTGMGTYDLITAAGTSMPVGSFDLTSQGEGTSTSKLGFSDVNIAAAVTPEPNSLVLLGTGLFGAAGMLFNRRRAGSSIL